MPTGARSSRQPRGTAARAPDRAVKTIRDLARRDREAQRPENSAALSKADQRIGELEKLVTSGVLSSEIAAPALEKARRERQSMLRAMGRKYARVPDAIMFEAEAEFRRTLAHMGEVLRGESMIEARETLREIIGSVRLVPDTDHLIAKYERSEIPLLRAVNGSWIGSGGLLRAL